MSDGLKILDIKIQLFYNYIMLCFVLYFTPAFSNQVLLIWFEKTLNTVNEVDISFCK